jgi:hypothetical protein
MAMKNAVYFLSFAALIVAAPAIAFELKNSTSGDRLRIELEEANRQESQNRFQEYVSELAASVRTDETNSKKTPTESISENNYKPWNPMVLFSW